MDRARDRAKDTAENEGTAENTASALTSLSALGSSRRRLLQGAALAAVPAALLTTRPQPAVAETRAVDYPGAESVPASTSNYTAASRPTSYPVDYVVIHVTQETYLDTLAIFKNPAKKVSAHYVVRSADGHIAQCVRERNVGWHAGNWSYNTRSIGIEHEGWVDKPEYFTDEMYERSAALTAAICEKYNIPKNREYIIGHSEVPGADHTDPGRYWDWTRYIRMVNVS
ncbi:N-acetylmuramoyl-L-alanine amidase [Streptomyces sp. NPDC017940]|uniref:N-acetylmuramoyl-L-alanine amidase n=1 Tax=Streptomyces sp. NPDC017940 TaxID=3365017 RepID=UPI003794D37F